MAEWISVLDDLPDSGDFVIMYICTPEYKGYHRVAFGQYWADGQTDKSYWLPDEWHRQLESFSGVSHWMPMPEPPVEN